jgi:hypothetical protein
MTRRLLVLLVLLLVTAASNAADLSGSNVLVPISGRTFGSYGSQWQTDLVIANLEPTPASIVVTFYGADDQRSFISMPLAGRGTIVLDDVLQKTFGMPNAIGMLRVNSATIGSRFTARAYVVNRGNTNGEYGQGVPAMPVDALTTEHVLSGVTGGPARRTNVGVANPWPVPATVMLTLHGADGTQLGSLSRLVPAFEVLQLNDVFAAFGAAPAAEASVRVTSQVGVYAYASIVRNDTGDAVFVAGTGVAPTTAAMPPRCSEPAPLGFAKAGQQPSTGWIVILKPDTHINYVTRTLPARYGYTISSLYESLPGFHAELTPQQLAGLRCEGTVLFIEQNVMVPVP